MKARLLVVALLAAAVVGCSPATPAGSPGTSAAAPTPAVSGPVARTPEASGSAAPGSPAPSSAVASPAPSGSPSARPARTPRFTLTSAAFHLNGEIPVRFTCDGADVSPAMAWTGTPDGTAWLVLLAEDPDAGNFAHWIAYAISPGTTRLAEGAGAANSRLAQGTNDFGRVGYGGPCPPRGTIHHYRFTLFALAAPIGLNGAPRASAVRAALAEASILGTATITARFGH